MSEASDNRKDVRERILQAIDRSERAKWPVKIKTLMEMFGYTALQRVRQSSFQEVRDKLHSWDIDYRFTGNSANDYITLSRGTAGSVETKPTTPEPAIFKAHTEAGDLPVEKKTPVAQPSEGITEDYFVGISPLAFLFKVGRAQDEDECVSPALDIQNAVWAYQPVCVLVDGAEEFFSFACGYFSAILRRRARIVSYWRSSWMSAESEPNAPEIMTVDRFKGFLGYDVDSAAGTFPRRGSIYLLHEDPNHPEDEETIASIRECFVPHTYRLKAKFSTTSANPPDGQAAEDDPGFPNLLKWISAFAGTVKLAQPSRERCVELASLFAEACQIRDTLLGRQALSPTDRSFRAGSESTEHMIYKSVLLKGLQQEYPGDVLVEELKDRNTEQTTDDTDPELDDRVRRDKPDLRIRSTKNSVDSKIWIEIETMRGLASRGSDPFFVLESKLRHKLENMRKSQQVWLIVPNDVALLANDQLSAVVRNLNSALRENKLRLGFVDMLSEKPVFLAPEKSPGSTDVRLSGSSWHTRTRISDRPLKMADIAGYSDLKRDIEGLLDPLKNPDKYSKHGLSAPNGLLLYGLPGCGKTLIGRVLAGEGGFVPRFLVPSDMTSMWLGQGTMKIRDLFDWALKNAPGCLLVLDELDAVAPIRHELNMHTDEKRQVNELLAQLDRVSGKGVVVVATTNYLQGIDSAIQRSGRFDVKLAVFPPNEEDRTEIFNYYLSRLKGLRNIEAIDRKQLARESILFTPADIRTVVEKAARKAIRDDNEGQPTLSKDDISEVMKNARSIHCAHAEKWVKEAEQELGPNDKQLLWLREEIARAFGTGTRTRESER